MNSALIVGSETELLKFALYLFNKLYGTEIFI